MFHYTSPKGAPQDGAYHAVSNDGLNFTQVADIPSDAQHNWTGNMIVDSLAMKFYGTGGSSMWFAATGNGNQWSPYQNLNLSGGDPAVLKTPRRNYILIYTGLPIITNISEKSTDDYIHLFPNPAINSVHVSGTKSFRKANYTITDLNGRVLKKGSLPDQENELSVQSFSEGLYLLKIESTEIYIHKFFQVCR